ncbi:hypothetical protein QBC35DRAFT_343544, partial [Podospora australis]
SRQAYHDSFGGFPTPSEAAEFRLPSYQDLKWFPETSEWDDLHDVYLSGKNIDDDSEHTDDAHRVLLGDLYARVAYPSIEVDDWVSSDRGEPSYRTLQSLIYCKNGLYDARHGNHLVAESVVYMTQRLLAWAMKMEVQVKPGELPRRVARLGTIDDGKWWVANVEYMLRVTPQGAERGGVTADLGKGAVFDALYKDDNSYLGDEQRFRRALVSIHVVYFANPHNHYAVIALHKPPKVRKWQAYYMDSMSSGHTQRGRAAFNELDKWLKRQASDLAPRGGFDRIIVGTIPPQSDAWSCGLMVIANALAFVRFESLGWNHSWPVDIRDRVVQSFHYIMGLKV